MAAKVSPWGKPGAWALDSEEHEAELLAGHPSDQNPQPTADFPSLAAAAATKPKKKKGQSISLAEFATYGGAKPPAVPNQPKGLTHEDILFLPTGPRERTAEELDRTRLGGGFRNYGSNGSYDRSNRHSNGDDSSNSRWGSSRVSDETKRNGGFGKEYARDAAPSRADEIDNWAAGKKPIASDGFEKRDRGWNSDSRSSKADDSDSWVSNKTFVPSETRRFSSNGSFDRERRGGFSSNGTGVDSDKWGKKEETIGVDLDKWGKKEEGVNRNTGERPRLNLQPRTVPISDDRKLEAAEIIAKPKGSNPFGEARPREEILAEKGQDWKKIDEKLELMKNKIKDKENVEKPDGNSHGKRSFGIGNGRVSEDRGERSWRKPDSVETHPESGDTDKDGGGEKKD